MADTQTLKYIITYQVANEAEAKAKLTSLRGAVEGVEGSMKKMTIQSGGLADSIAKLTYRAALTIPVWLAMRQAFVTTLTAITDSADSIVKLDTALHNAQLEIQSTTTNIAAKMDLLKQAAVSLSKETGTSADKIVDVFKAFATEGLTVTESMAGMNTAVKGTIATNGEAIETARFLADVYLSLGDRITEVSGAQDKMNFIMNTVATLMPTNSFTMKEFTGAAGNFVSVAKQMNLTLDQTFVLIATSATAMQRGTRAGTQLSSAFQQLAVHGQEVRDFLGASFKEGDSFGNFIGVLRKLSTEGSSVTTTLKDIFGLRGLRVTGAEAAIFSHVVDEIERLNKLSPSDRQAQMMDRLQTSMDKLATQADRVKQAFLSIGRDFLTGIFGDADKISKELKSVADSLDNISVHAKEAGQFVKELGVALVSFGTASAATGLLAKLGAGGAAAGQLGGIGALGAAAIGTNQFVSQRTKDFRDIEEEANRKAMNDFLRNNDIQRQKNGLPPVRPDLAEVRDLGTIEISKTSEQIAKSRLSILNTDEKIELASIRMRALGFNELEIQENKVALLEEEEAKRKALVELAKMYNDEIAKTSQELQKTVSGALSGLIQGQGTFKDFAKKIGDAMRSGIADAFAENITEQIFTTTGIGEMFGGLLSGIRHAGSGIGAPIKKGFDYGAEKSYQAIVRGFNDGVSQMSTPGGAAEFGGAGGGVSGGGILSQLFGGGNGKAGGLTIPGFGQGGFFNTHGFGATGQNANGELINSSGQTVNSFGQTLGNVGGSVLLGYSQYQAAGGKNGSLSAVSGGLATAAMLDPEPISKTLLLIASFVTGAFSKTKSTDVSVTNKTEQIGTKIDVSNKQLQLVNRNLIALRSDIRTFILPESAYFAEKSSVDDMFALDSRRS
jgi:TP901 family phage tail tape measure protein